MKNFLLIAVLLLFFSDQSLAQTQAIRYSKTYEQIYGGNMALAQYSGVGILKLSKSYLFNGSNRFGLLGNSDPALYQYLLPTNDYVNMTFIIDELGNVLDTVFYEGFTPYLSPTLSDTIAIVHGADRVSQNQAQGVMYFIGESGVILDEVFIPEIDEISSIVLLPDSGFILVGHQFWELPPDGFVKLARLDKNKQMLWQTNYFHNEPAPLGSWYNRGVLGTDAQIWDDSTIIVQYLGASTLSYGGFGYLLLDMNNGEVFFDKAYQSFYQRNYDTYGTSRLVRRKSGNFVSIAPHRIPADPIGYCGDAGTITGLDLNFTPDWMYINQWYLDDLRYNCHSKYLLYDLLVREDSTILACGFLYDSLYATDSAGFYHASPYIRFTPVLIGLNDAGKLLWQKYVDPEVVHQGRFTSMAETPDGGLILTGSQNFYPTGRFGAPWVLKLDADYCLEPGCKDSSILNRVDPSDLIPLDEVQIWPNPTKNKFRLMMSDATFAGVDRLILYNLLGQEVFIQKIDSPQSSFDISLLPASTYIAQVITRSNKPLRALKLLHLGP
jgi:hypothetical protein